MKSRKVFALTAILILIGAAIAVASGAGGETVATEETTIKVLMKDSGEWGTPSVDRLLYAEAIKATGVNLEIELIPGDAAIEQLNVRLAAGDVPDATEISRPMTQQYGPQGALTDFVELFDVAPNLKKKFSIDSNPWLFTPEGKLFFLPVSETPYMEWGWVWRQDIADELGIETPETIDDWVAAWRTVKAARPDSIPWMAMWGVPMGHLAPAYGIGGDSRSPYTFRDGVFSHPFISDEYREILTLMAMMYEEGILWPEFLSADWDTFQAAQASGETFSTTFYSGTMFNYVTDDIRKNIKPVPAPRGPRGHSGHDWLGASAYWGMGIPVNSKNPEAAARFFDFLMSEEGEILYLFGKEGVTFERTDDGMYNYTDEVREAAKTEGRDLNQYLMREYLIRIGSFGSMVLRPALSIQRSISMGGGAISGYTQSQAMVATSLAPYPPPVWSNDEEQKRINTLNTDIDTYYKEWQAKFITGNEPLSKWSEYVAGMKSLGVDEVIALVNAGYERYLEIAGRPKGYVPTIEIDTEGLLESVGLK
jgi:putative aldouronate transport system substrate-binding protein